MMCLAPFRASLAVLGLNVFRDHIIRPISAVNTPYCSRITIGIPLYVLFRVFVFIYLFCVFGLFDRASEWFQPRLGLRVELFGFPHHSTQADFANEPCDLLCRDDMAATPAAVFSFSEGLEFS